MTCKEIISAIEKGNPANVYLLMGEEPYYLDQIVEALERCVVAEEDRDFNQYAYYGAEADLDEVVTTCRRYPMMTDRQLVILKEGQAMERARTNLERLAEYVKNPSPTTVFALVFKGESFKATSELMKAAAASKAVVFKSPKLRDWQLKAPINEYCAARQVKIDPDAVQVIIDYIGADLSRTFSEIDKLVIGFKPGERRITRDIVLEKIGISKEFNAYEITQAVGRRDYAKSQFIVNAMSKNPTAYPVQPLTSTLFNYFTKLALCQLSPDKSDAAFIKICEAKGESQYREYRTAINNWSGILPFKAIHELRIFDAWSKGNGSKQPAYPLLIQTLYKIFTF